MRELADYRIAEWVTARPLTHGFKRARNVVIERLFRRKRSPGLDSLIAKLLLQKPDTIGVVIAYNIPWVIDLTTRITRKNFAGTLIVCDNSRSPAARREIEKICIDRGVAYLGLPYNPVRHPSRSHGIAINWVYYNIIDVVRPKVFGIIDHDLFPLERVDFAAEVADQPVYGERRPGGQGWHLWAGYCAFDRVAVEKNMLDFNTDTPRWLDTGGRNWVQIYSKLDSAKLRFAKSCWRLLRSPGFDTARPMSMIDNCLHVIGASYDDRAKNSDTKAYIEGIVRHIENGGALADLQVGGDLTENGPIGGFFSSVLK